MIHSIELTREQVDSVVCTALCEIIKRELDYKEEGVPWNKELAKAAALVVKRYLNEEEWETFKELIAII